MELSLVSKRRRRAEHGSRSEKRDTREPVPRGRGTSAGRHRAIAFDALDADTADEIIGHVRAPP